MFPQKGQIFIHDICNNSKSTRTFQECNGIPVPEWLAYWKDMNIYREHLEYNEESGNQMPCRKDEMWKPVCEAWYSVAPNVLEKLNTPMPRRITDLIKAKEDTKKY